MLKMFTTVPQYYFFLKNWRFRVLVVGNILKEFHISAYIQVIYLKSKIYRTLKKYLSFKKMDLFFEIKIFVSIFVFGTVPYFLFVYVLVPGYGHKPTQQTASKNMFMLKMLTILP